MNGTETPEPLDQRVQPSSMLRSSVSILLRPRRTMRALIDSESRAGYRVLPALSGLVTAPSAAFTVAAVIEGYDTAIWIGALVLSVLGFWMYVSVYGYAYRLIGGWFGAGGTTDSSRLALAWTQIPFILLWVIVLPLQIRYRSEFFPEIDLQALTSDSLDEITALLEVERSTGFMVTNAVFYLGALLAWVWSLFVLGEALECPAWKAFLIKMMAVALHIPLLMVASVFGVILAIAIVLLFPPV